MLLAGMACLSSPALHAAQGAAAPPGEEGPARAAAYGVRIADPAPPRAEGQGPHDNLVITNVMLINGEGAVGRFDCSCCSPASPLIFGCDSTVKNRQCFPNEAVNLQVRISTRTLRLGGAQVRSSLLSAGRKCTFAILVACCLSVTPAQSDEKSEKGTAVLKPSFPNRSG